MAWSYSIIEKNLDGGIPKATVEFTNGTNTFLRTIIATNNDKIKSQIQSNLDEAQANELFINALPLGTFSDLTVSAPVLTDKQKFLVKYEQLKKFDEIIKLGITTNQNATYTALLNWVKTNFDASYF
jgi:hypothetical protein